MYQSKEEAIGALADVKEQIEAILDEGVWVDDEDERFLQDIEAVAKEMEAMQNELQGAIMQLKWAGFEQYLTQQNRNYVSLTIMEAKALISKFHILQGETA